MNDKKQFSHMIVEGNTIIFISCNDIFPALYKIDLLENKIKCLGELPWDNGFQENILLGKIEDVIIIAPYWNKRKFLKYDMRSASFQCVFLEQEVWADDFFISAFSNVVQYNRSLFFIGNKNGIIVEYSKEHDQFFIHNIVLPKELVKEDLCFFWSSIFLIDNILYLPIEKGGLLKVNILDFQTDYIKLAYDYRCFSMSLIENQLWMMPYCDNKIMIFDLKTENYSIIEFFLQSEECPFMAAVDFGDEVLLMPMKSKKILSISKLNHKISEKKEFELDALKKEQIQRQFLAICKDKDGNTYLQKNGSLETWVINKKGILKKYSFFINYKNIKKIFEKSKAAERRLWMENININIYSILWILSYCNHINRVEKNNYGCKIWNCIKNNPD